MKKLIYYFMILALAFCLFHENNKAEPFPLNGELSSEIIIKYNQIDLIKMKHEIYARKGYLFKTKWLEEYFRKFSWYNPVNDFKYSSLDKNDWNNIKIIDDALYEKEKSTSAKMNKKKKYQIKYYLKDFELKEYPKEIKTAITDHIKKNNNGSTIGYWFPLFYKTNFQNEVSVKQLEELLNPDGFRYYICMYDDGKLVRIIPRIESPGLYDEPIHFLDDYGNVVFIEGNNPGAYGGYRWFFYYENGEVVSISLTRWSLEENIPDSKIERTFFYR